MIRGSAKVEDLAHQSEPASPSALSRLMLDRYSCRAYTGEPVPRPTIELMLGIAQLSASWCNSQPWNIIVTEGIGTERFRSALFAHATSCLASGDQGTTDYPFPAAYEGVYRQRRREVGWQLYDSVGIAQGDRAASSAQALENFRLFGAPHALIVTSELELGTYGALDCGVYLGSLMLAAESLGIGMIPQAALASFSDFIRSYFALPPNRLVLVGASFGIADIAHPANGFRSQRADLSEVVTWSSE